MRATKPDASLTRPSLLGRIRNWNDEASWDEFDRLYRRMIKAFAMGQGLREKDAEDVTQETLLAVSKAIKTFEYDRKRSSFRNWLFTVTRHRVEDFRRRQRKDPDPGTGRRGDSTRTSTVARLADPQTSPLEAAWDEEWTRTVTKRAREKLKAKVSVQYYQVFHLSVEREQPTSKVAAALGVTSPWIHLVRHRVNKHYQKLLAQEASRLDRPPPLSSST